jgi:glycosyltransferase involved in cell wall biosynthesis
VTDRRRLRVLHTGKFYPPHHGGMESILADLCIGTAAEWDVRVVVAGDEPRTVAERLDGIGVVRVATWGAAGPVPICPTLPFHIWRQAADCVVLHEPNPLAALTLFSRTPGRRLVIWHHSDVLRPAWAVRPYALLQRVLYRRAACAVFATPPMAQRSAARLRANRVAVIPYGIDIRRHGTLSADQAALVQYLRAAAPGPRILFVGRLVYYKGLEVLFRAMRGCPGRVWIVGEGPLRESLQALVVDLGLSDRVAFMSGVSTQALVAYYHAADIFVLPSTEITEAFGLVQVEAMAAGCPVVSTALPTGVPWVNQDGVTGLIVPPRDVEALAGAIRRLGDDPGLRRRMGEAARTRAQEQFSRERMVRDFKALVENVVSGAGGCGR